MDRANNIYSDEELQIIQEIELKILDEIVDICEKNNIEYFLIGGTCLGAVRHNGFIPWDDDIDIGMTRQNYNKFITIAKRSLSNKYILQTPDDSTCPYYFTKVRRAGTKFVEYCNRKIKMPQGIYVDIFPFDEVPNDDAIAYKQWKKLQKQIKILVYRQSPSWNVKPSNFKLICKSIARKFIHIALKIIPYRLLKRQLDTGFTQYNGTNQDAIACLNFPKFKTEYIRKSDLYPLKKHIFNEKEYYIPNEVDKYLKTHYGNYMELPPIEQRFGHKPFLIDLGNNKPSNL